MEIRDATEKDAQTLFKWANDPVTRANSFVKDEIKFDEHVKWLNKKLASKDSVIFIGAENDVPLGVIRFDRQYREAVLSIGIDEQFRGKGKGKLLIEEAVKELNKRKFCKQIIAYVKIGNVSSVKLFEKAGFFQADNSQDIKYPDALKYLLKIDPNE